MSDSIRCVLQGTRLCAASRAFRTSRSGSVPALFASTLFDSFRFVCADNFELQYAHCTLASVYLWLAEHPLLVDDGVASYSDFVPFGGWGSPSIKQVLALLFLHCSQSWYCVAARGCSSMMLASALADSAQTTTGMRSTHIRRLAGARSAWNLPCARI